MKKINFGFLGDYRKDFGGSQLKNKRKSKRPLSTKKPIHLILKMSGRNFFNPGNRSLEQLIHSQANKYKITIYRLSLNWSHMHLVIKLPHREAYNAFIRTLTALIVSAIAKFKNENLTGLFDQFNGPALATKLGVRAYFGHLSAIRVSHF
jgi:REP element-mobilizing transposase RayT